VVKGIGGGRFNVHHSRPDAVAEGCKRARNATTAGECRLWDVVFVLETSFEEELSWSIARHRYTHRPATLT
jgi:hypothetical protein